MEKLLNAIRPLSRLIALICFLVAGFITLVLMCTSFPSNFLGAIGHLFNLFIVVGIYLIIPFLWIFKKDNIAKNCLLGFAVYWLITNSLNYTSALSNFDTDVYGALLNITFIILFLVGALFVAVMVLVILGRTIKKEKLVEVGKLLLLITIPAMAFAFIFVLIIEIDRGTNFADVMDTINTYLIVPVAVVFGLLSIEDK